MKAREEQQILSRVLQNGKKNYKIVSKKAFLKTLF
ncbi:hypothetical protein N203_07120 [Helicobacter pylori UM084]|nr:hypothetical protein N203_07120 [Helicobacter pylori UM084]